MNQINKYSSVEWYIEEISKIIVHKNTLPKNLGAKYREKEREISQYLCKHGITADNFTNPISESIFENFITAEYSDLKMLSSIKYEIDDNIPKYFKMVYNKFSSNNINNLIVQKSNVQVCPYCNENYIINRGNNYTTAQLDHFIDKAKNPLFAICLYNLIPCCSACNHIKAGKNLHISPFDTDIDRDQFKITYSPTSANFITDSDAVTLNFLTEGINGEDILHDIEQLEIDESYMFHKDYLSELLKKAHIYNHSRIEEILNLFKDVGSSKEELYRIIFGNYTDYENINSRPLSKLTQDILKELKIIE